MLLQMAAMGRQGDGAIPGLGTCILHSGDKSLGDNMEVSLHITPQPLHSRAPNTSAKGTCPCRTKAKPHPAHLSFYYLTVKVHSWSESTQTWGRKSSSLPCAEVLLQMVPCLPLCPLGSHALAFAHPAITARAQRLQISSSLHSTELLWVGKEKGMGAGQKCAAGRRNTTTTCSHPSHPCVVIYEAQQVLHHRRGGRGRQYPIMVHVEQEPHTAQNKAEGIGGDLCTLPGLRHALPMILTAGGPALCQAGRAERSHSATSPTFMCRLKQPGADDFMVTLE